MITNENLERVRGWFTGRLPGEWTQQPPGITVDREEITVMLTLPDVDAAPVMTRLRQPQRQVLDTLVEAGVARSRADALAWCVRLVGEHEAEWLEELREAMSHVVEVRTKGPASDR